MRLMGSTSKSMILKKTLYLLLSGMTILAACKKQDSDTPSNGGNITPDDCVHGVAAEAGDIIEGKYIVMYKTGSESARTTSTDAVDGVQLSKISEDALSRNNINPRAFQKSFSGGVKGFIANITADEAAKLKQDPEIEIVEPDRIIALNTCFTVVEPRLVTWNIERVGYGNGIGKKAWIIDTGIDFEHPDLTVDKAKSKSFIAGETSADDENGHGTHVAGIIGGKNNSFGVLGVASGATLISLRVLDKDGKGSLSNIIQALSYINANAAAGDVVNMSVGDEDGISEVLDQQVKNTAARGIYIAIAAGNESEAANKYSPGRANAPNIYTVSAIDSTGTFASFSNFGNDVVDYAAPGVRILSTYLNNKYAYMSGTSMAAPHMAGLLLLKGSKITTSGAAKEDPDGTADPIAHY
jgi:subtilisin